MTSQKMKIIHKLLNYYALDLALTTHELKPIMTILNQETSETNTVAMLKPIFITFQQSLQLI